MLTICNKKAQTTSATFPFKGGVGGRHWIGFSPPKEKHKGSLFLKNICKGTYHTGAVIFSVYFQYLLDMLL